MHDTMLVAVVMYAGENDAESAILEFIQLPW